MAEITIKQIVSTRTSVDLDLINSFFEGEDTTSFKVNLQNIRNKFFQDSLGNENYLTIPDFNTYTGDTLTTLNLKANIDNPTFTSQLTAPNTLITGNFEIGSSIRGYKLGVSGVVNSDVIAQITNSSTSGYGLNIQNGDKTRYALAIADSGGNINIHLYGDGRAIFNNTITVSTIKSSDSSTSNGSNLNLYGGYGYPQGGSVFIDGGAGAGSSGLGGNIYIGTGNTNTIYIGNTNILSTGITGSDQVLFIDSNFKLKMGSTLRKINKIILPFPSPIWDIDHSINAQITLTTNTSLNIINIVDGDKGTLQVIQGGTGSYGLTLPANSIVENGGSGVVVLSTAVGSKDLLSFYYDGTNYFWNLIKNYT